MTERPPNNGREKLPGYKRAKARLHHAKLVKTKAHPDAIRAALGRMLVHGGDGYPAACPQALSTSIEAVAWYRESGAWPGYRNRHNRSKENA